MLKWYLTDTYQYLHDYSLFNWSYANVKLVLIDTPNQYLPIFNCYSPIFSLRLHT